MFKKAERKKAKLRLGIAGPSGSGKTWSALEIATGLGGKIALIDTECGRGELYGEDFEYDSTQITAPYSPDKYIEAIKTAERMGYDTLIIDSLSHAWAGEGGILSIADRAGNGNSFTGWRVATPKQNQLIDTIIASPLHIIVTLRVKTDYVLEPNEKGKLAPRKVGLAPIQKDNLEYEFTVFMNLNQDHIAHVSKDNTKLFDQEYIKPSKEMGSKLVEWLNYGKECEPFVPNENYFEKIEKAQTLSALKAIYEKAKVEVDNLSLLNQYTNKRKQELEMQSSFDSDTGEML